MLDGKYFRAVDEDGNPVRPERDREAGRRPRAAVDRPDGRSISFFGDLHPSFFGNVVKAMGSAKQGYPIVSAACSQKRRPASTPADDAFSPRSTRAARDRARVSRLTPTIVEVVVHAPLAARRSSPASSTACRTSKPWRARPTAPRLAMEGLALTGAWVDRNAAWSRRSCSRWAARPTSACCCKPGEPVMLMGPTGTPTEIPTDETVVLVGGGLGNAVLFSIGQALRARGLEGRSISPATRSMADRYKVAEIEAAADVVVWCCDEAPGFTPTRPQDAAFVGNIVQAMHGVCERRSGRRRRSRLQARRPHHRDRLRRMMAAVARARHGVLAAVSQAASTWRSARSTRRCNA